jgi:hypothetical protein
VKGFIAQYFGFLLPAVFVLMWAAMVLVWALMWLAITTLLSVLSGWFRLMEKFPDQIEEPFLRIRGQAGSMGFNMPGILRLSVCPSGLRVGITRLFGPFCRDFFVPWRDINITRKKALFRSVAELQFGRPSIGRLTVSAHVANRLAHAAVGRWPEADPPPVEKRSDTLRRLLIQWALSTGWIASFFTLFPLLLAPKGGGVPIALAILFPAIFFGVFTILRYMRERN